LGVHDNLPKVKKDADAPTLSRAVLNFACAVIKDALPLFHELSSHHHLGLAIKSYIYNTFQVSQTTQAQSSSLSSLGERNPNIVKLWRASKIFLDHDLLQALTDLNACYYGPHFYIHSASLEKVFNKTEWLPVSSF
jgi:hypothetical protein